MVRLGIISDTHGLLRPEALAQLRGSDQLIHGGDIGNPAILEVRPQASAVAVQHLRRGLELLIINGILVFAGFYAVSRPGAAVPNAAVT